MEVGPAQFVLDLLVALLGPRPQSVEADDLGEVGRRVRAGGCALVAAWGASGWGRLVARYQVALSGRTAGSVVATTSRPGESGP
ncbi:hypothetical protein [Streptomyces ipomoeae]|uniref:hypothetical protein n=1 Tax=Streptomyces ipomoeae TaxID=103232 RepID=UPI0011707B0D|nr:hypothetical protein [Streptomyces ipomoeae]TQE31951.1 hypothetical protein SipoB123_00525 [Streptomyces ipomoeae]